jgi:hypothetical protein
MLESAGFEMAQMVWYRGSCVAIKEQGEKGHSTQNIVEEGNKQYQCRGLLIELGCCNSSNVLKTPVPSQSPMV